LYKLVNKIETIKIDGLNIVLVITKSHNYFMKLKI